ncbi:MAG TPA: NUDIX hydrolase [Caulobacteraceae bacterium]|jgi:8-oxo-dGTP pyrophosphatase MutT (NUDIX family)|nr:NUDIX hydrolase [Caulobacteraceae bacterium]
MKPIHSDTAAPPWDDLSTRPPAWTSDAGAVRFENPWLQLVEYAATAPTGHPAQFGVVRFKNRAVGVLPLHEDGTVVLVGQHRFPRANYSWEMPEGGAPFDEAPLDGARRELREEAGLDAAHWREALTMELSNSVTDEEAVCYLAWGLTSAAAAPDPTESLAIARVPFRALLAEAAAGRIQDALTVATAFRAYHMAREGELPQGLARAMLG